MTDMVRISLNMEEGHKNGPHWIDVREVLPGLFVIEDDSSTDLCFDLVFEAADSEVVDVCIDLQIWNDVWLTPNWFRAPSSERLTEALQHVFWYLSSNCYA